MAVAAMSAAALAYRKETKRARQKGSKHHPAWMNEFIDRMPETSPLDDEEKEKEGVMVAKQRELSGSSNPYEQLAWYTFLYITSRGWFEAFVMLNILFIGIATGVDLQYGDGPYPGAHRFVAFVSTFTTIVFTFECAFKLIAEGLHPQTCVPTPATAQRWLLPLTVHPTAPSHSDTLPIPRMAPSIRLTLRS